MRVGGEKSKGFSKTRVCQLENLHKQPEMSEIIRWKNRVRRNMEKGVILMKTNHLHQDFFQDKGKNRLDQSDHTRRGKEE